MAKHNGTNARIKREYFAYLKEAQRRDEASIDAVAKALGVGVIIHPAARAILDTLPFPVMAMRLLPLRLPLSPHFPIHGKNRSLIREPPQPPYTCPCRMMVMRVARFSALARGGFDERSGVGGKTY